MGLFPTLKRAEHAVEMLDRPAALVDLAECLADLARLNAIFGGGLLTVRHVSDCLPTRLATAPSPCSTSAREAPTSLGPLARWARRAGRRIRILALDRDRRRCLRAQVDRAVPGDRLFSRAMRWRSRCEPARSTS
jgi:hypothetical protein